MKMQKKMGLKTLALVVASMSFVLSPAVSQERRSPTRVVSAGEMALIDDIEDGFVSLFDGKTLAGWEQKNGTATYEVVDETILGTTVEGSPNSFLCTDKEYSDFDFRFEFKVDKELNSGVQIRSMSKPGFQKGRVHGPQVEIEGNPGEAGYIYSEATGRKWISPEQPIKDSVKNGEWNTYRVVADGARVQTWVNGRAIEDIEMDPVESRKGFFGLQVHSIKKGAGPYKVQWRNIRIKELDGTETRSAQAFKGTPVIDGKVDEAWASVPRMVTSREVEEHNQLKDDQVPATASVKCMWDDEYLYCLAVVKDSEIGSSGSEPYECDSVEIFVDGNMSMAASYDADDAQYRTGADGEESGGSSTEMGNYKSVVTKTDDGYIVEAQIKLATEAGKKIGFDVQVNNDAGGGMRQSTMKWNDPSNETWQDMSDLGVLELVDEKR
jgi:hypothetical protein